MMMGQHPKPQLGLVDFLYVDCQPDLFTFPAGRVTFLCLGPAAGNFSFILLRLDIINVKYFCANL